MPVDISYFNLSNIDKQVLIPEDQCIAFADAYISKTHGMAVMIIALLIVIAYLLYREFKEK